MGADERRSTKGTTGSSTRTGTGSAAAEVCDKISETAAAADVNVGEGSSFAALSEGNTGAALESPSPERHDLFRAFFGGLFGKLERQP